MAIAATVVTVAVVVAPVADPPRVAGARDAVSTAASFDTTPRRLGAGGVLRVRVADAVGGKTVIGQLTVDRVVGSGFVTAFGCDRGLPLSSGGAIDRSDLNFDGRVAPVAANRLIVEADDDGEVCFFTSAPTDMIVDINGVSDTGIMSFANQRTDTRQPGVVSGPTLPADGSVPVWPSLTPGPPLEGVAALTGERVSVAVAAKPIVAVKVDNYRLARPQWSLDLADAVIEENAEGVTRFIALFHTRHPGTVGPVRSARTADLDLLAAMNRPVFAYSGANGGVNAWIRSAADSGVLVDHSAQHRPCYQRDPSRPGPHNLVLDAGCAAGFSAAAGPARPLWTIDSSWTPPIGMPSTADDTFRVRMDGVVVEWTWDPATRRYLRSQDGQPHLAASGARLAARTVVEVMAHHVPSPVDARSPHPITVGQGAAVVHRGGRAITAVWNRPTPYAAFEFREVTTGAVVPLDDGVTFVTLVRDR